MSAAAARVRALVVDDNPVVRMGLRSLLEASGRVEVVGEAANGAEAAVVADHCRPEVVLLDVRMPLVGGLEVAGALAARARVLMVSYAHEPDTVARSLREGAAGYLVHGRFDPAELVQAVVGTAAGATVLSPEAAGVLLERFRGDARPGRDLPDHADSGLSRREREVMDLVAAGRSNTGVAADLFLSEKTVKNHINRIYAKLGVRTRGEAIATWLGVAPPRRAALGPPRWAREPWAGPPPAL